MTRPLTVLSIAFPFAKVGPDAVGGAEQVLSAIDRALGRSGHRSIVIACEGSHPPENLLRSLSATASPSTKSCARTRIALCVPRLSRRYGKTPSTSCICTASDFMPGRAPVHRRWSPCICRPTGTRRRRFGRYVRHMAARRLASSAPRVVPGRRRAGDLVTNRQRGSRLTLGAHRHARRGFALMLGRVCPEKGQHLGLDAAHIAQMPVLMAGEVFPYPAHQSYFETEITPAWTPNDAGSVPWGLPASDACCLQRAACSFQVLLRRPAHWWQWKRQRAELR